MAAATLLELAGADLTPAKVADAALIIIDMQNEYRAGPVAVTGFEPAVAAAANLLDAARKAGSPIFHVAQKGRAGGLFDRAAERGQFTAELVPQSGEALVEKPLPNAFAGTELAGLVAETGRKNLIIVGCMTHMCVSSTARAALDLGYRVTIDASACATRDLADGRGGVIAAAVLHDVALAELADRFAIVTRESGALL